MKKFAVAFLAVAFAFTIGCGAPATTAPKKEEPKTDSKGPATPEKKG